MAPRKTPTPASSKPPSSRSAKPPSAARRAPRASTATNASFAPTIVESGDADADGDVSMAEPSGHGDPDGPARKKGRVAELAKTGATGLGRKGSVRSVQVNQVPQPPAPATPHLALFIFGTGDMGQFGLGPDELEEIGRPKLHSWFEEQIEDGKLSRDGTSGSGGLETVAAGGMHTLAIDEGGKVRSWGINDNAALGRITANVPDPNDPSATIPNEDLETYPFVVETLEKEGFRAVKVAAGDSVSVALSDKGEIRVWGSFRSNDGVLGFDGVPGHSPFQFTPVPLPSLAKVKITDVSCGSDHVLALTTTGHVYVWGNGQQNQLGRRIMERRRLNGLEPERLALRNIVLVSAGMFHSFAVDKDGQVFAWGLNTFHQTGIPSSRGGDEDMINSPTRVEALSPEEHGGAKVVQIEGGEHHSIFLFDNGEVWGVGRSDANQLGLSKDHPAQEGLKERRAEAIKVKEEAVTAARKKLDEVANSEDQDVKEEAERELAGTQAAMVAALDEFVPEPVRIAFPPIPEKYEVVPPFPSWAESRPQDNPIAHISAGTRHNLAVSRSGHVYSWGLGVNAQLGLGSEETAEVPSLVRSKSLRPYTAVYASAGGQHCVLLAHLTKDANAMDLSA
ncbi:Poly(A)+ RNA transport protein 2 [Saitozyma sp. JCM 24511]|nr:Poly(A)+ RNA transport protein 2 [Saitozyma sp. JCM 24511]